MFGLTLRRAAHGLLVLWLVTTATFFLIHAAPGGPAVLADPKLSPTERAAIERQLGIDQPLTTQYLRWQLNLIRGDLGNSFLYQTPTLATIGARLPNTLLLVSLTLVLAVVVAVPLGIAVGLNPGSRLDRLVGAVNFSAMAIPTFWFGILAILLVSVRWRLLPAGGLTTPGVDALGDRIRHLLLPVLVLGFTISAELVRFVRAGVLQTVAARHLLPARARGLSDAQLRRRHILRNALLPLLTALGLQIPILVGGAAVTETVFAWPGMGRLSIEAALGRDYPLVLGITVVVALTVVAANFLLDLCYAWADPRVRLRD